MRPDRKDEKTRRSGNFGGLRQWIEAFYDTCKDQLKLDAATAAAAATSRFVVTSTLDAIPASLDNGYET